MRKIRCRLRARVAPSGFVPARDVTPANEELFRQRATEYAVFLAAHGYEPRSTPDDPDERRLAGWIRNCRAAAAGTGAFQTAGDGKRCAVISMVERVERRC